MKEFHNQLVQIFTAMKGLFVVVLGLFVFTWMVYLFPEFTQYIPEESGQNEEQTFSTNAADILKEGEGKLLVIQNCTSCHSARLIDQNRATTEGWTSMIRWMQSSQNLWDLGENENAILQYLATNYGPEKKGRRANLKGIEWFELKKD